MNIDEWVGTVGLDAFGRMRVSEPSIVLDSKLLFDEQSLVWATKQTGAGTSVAHSTDRASYQMSVSSLTAGSVIRQSRRRANYQPGKSQQFFITFRAAAVQTGITMRVGAFDASNGIFFEVAPTGMSFVIRSSASGSPVDTKVALSNKILVDGTTALDPSKVQLLAFDFGWQGVGDVRIGFLIGGKIVYGHTFRHSNTSTAPWASTPNLPIRYEITNDGTGGAATLEQICVQVSSEGGQTITGVQRSADRGSTPLVTLNDADFYPLVAIRLKSTHLGAFAIPTQLGVQCTSAALFLWRLILNPTVTGTALSYSDVTNSALQAAVGATNATKVSGGTVLASGYSEQAAASPFQLTVSSLPAQALGADIDGVRDEMVLAVARISGTAETFYASLGWHEMV